MTIEIMQQAMENTVEAFRTELKTLRTGRAHPGLLERVTVDYYGSLTPLKQMANITVSDPQSLLVTPWDKQALDMIIKAIQTSDLGLTAMAASDAVRVPIPPLTEERRRDLVKHLKAEAEKSKINVRNLRRAELAELKDLAKEKLIWEDDERRAAAQVQKVTDQMIATLDQSPRIKKKS